MKYCCIDTQQYNLSLRQERMVVEVVLKWKLEVDCAIVVIHLETVSSIEMFFSKRKDFKSLVHHCVKLIWIKNPLKERV